METNSTNMLTSLNFIKNVPPSAYYVPNFITDNEEEELMKHVSSCPLPKWTQLSNRRLQNWGGIPHQKGMIAEEIPKWLKKYMDRISSLNIFSNDKLPNHVLINEYLSGQGIMGHTDGPLFHSIVTTISCGSHTLLEFTKRLDTEENQRQLKPEFSFLLERRSLLVLQDTLYHDYLHSISECNYDIIESSYIRNLDLCSFKYEESEKLNRKTRISLTIRHVPKTSKLKLKF
ncbi:GSCOCG00005343001-RA-CDS [Cotesia congregata]|uniref:Similar to alkbh6: Alpha-ketoglutarate-dependent dioxygenase alkB homolog 6 (Danio rerio) n=1 Tax=Cotesia congregata TaxID=51543 RepID=A0A8J2HK21_COTCN|nr:GSCOCG00005343001-RA-CDS [Cotesia congregata]CAG5100902.1 Similar to alkbh6: Alpha-ketoglutarate-dependent dioxygenase alkB homolog 6 (Danio rerio) [Cotesia congregata]